MGPIEEDWEHPLKRITWDIRHEGRGWNAEEVETRYFMAPEKMELIDGKLYWSDDDRIMMLGMLLENLGVDRAVQLGNPQIWREALALLGSAS